MIAETAVIYPNVFIGEDVTIFPGAVIGRPPMGAGTVHNKPESALMTTRIGDKSVIGANAVIYTGVYIGINVLIGDGATIRENCVIEDAAIIGNNCTLQNDVIVGTRSRVIDLSHITAGVIIGEDAFVSTGVLTMNDNAMARGGELRPPIIAASARVGGGAVLLPGVHIGENAMVAAGSIVTKDVAADQRVQGVAAAPYRKDGMPRDLADEWWKEYYFDYYKEQRENK